MIDDIKMTSTLISCGKFIIATSLMYYLAHLHGHGCDESCSLAQPIKFANLRKTFDAAMGPSLLIIYRAFLVIILEQHHRCFSLLYETPIEVNKKCRLRDLESFSYLQQSYCNELACITDVHDSFHMKEVRKIVGLSKREKMKTFRIVAYVMILVIWIVLKSM